MQVQALATVRGQLVEIISGTFFLSIGFTACAIAAIRRVGVRLFLWLGVWSAMYGTGLLTRTPQVVAALPTWLQLSVPYVNAIIAYLTVVVAFLAFLELSVGRLRLVIQSVIILGIAVAVAGVSWVILGGSENKFIGYNYAVTVAGLLVLFTVLAVKKLSDKFLVLLNRRVLAGGMLIFVSIALWVNLSRTLSYNTPALVNHLGFAAFLLSLGYVGVQMVFADERRLLSIEKELEVARQLQSSILPATIPEIQHLQIAVSYQPMAAVAGDFYEFVRADGKCLGLLVADVTGHGVPAALIASMIKVAIQSVEACAQDPREVLRELNRILFKQIHEQYVSAAYLWLDTESGKACYSAAGHPPLLRWKDGKLERIESNGLLFGIIADPDYPVREFAIHPGERLVLYTDGLIEPQNASGEFFGDRKLEEVVRKNQARPPVELLEQMLAEVRAWLPNAQAQQDDITLMVIDVQ
ncbi:MAG TPA: PP2C family protein-serine/threonine phosphatase [Candidatus Sulfotelmatobacter sp.]|nr:PP2C family protein-serine/threonine phosphatase [Candidatus Sulfotelmatobacter sp.]